MMKYLDERYQFLIDDMELREKMINEIIEAELNAITEEQIKTLVAHTIKYRWRIGTDCNTPPSILSSHDRYVTGNKTPSFYWINDNPVRYTY